MALSHERPYCKCNNKRTRHTWRVREASTTTPAGEVGSQPPVQVSNAKCLCSYGIICYARRRRAATTGAGLVERCARRPPNGTQNANVQTNAFVGRMAPGENKVWAVHGEEGRLGECRQETSKTNVHILGRSCCGDGKAKRQTETNLQNARTPL